ncbi:MAG: ribonuclease P protein component [Puniceicoccales bacterium]|nr:ribonuclease P protein component [Puniceicoccales bacterium]
MHRLLKSQRVRKSSDFARFRSGDARSVRSEVFIFKTVLCRANGDCHRDWLPRIGIVTAKKVGNAVKRNRIRRIVREWFRLNPEAFGKGHDYLFIALRGIAAKSNGEIFREISHAAKKLPRVSAPRHAEGEESRCAG